MARATRLAAMIVLALPGIARAAEPPCLSPAEFASLAGYALPSVIKGTVKRCSTVLAPKAFLQTNGEQLAARYATRKAKDWPGAKAAFIKLNADKDKNVSDIFAKMPDESLQETVDVIIEGMVRGDIPTEKCGTISDFVRLLAPLPPENTAELIALTVGLVSAAKEGKVGKLTICSS